MALPAWFLLMLPQLVGGIGKLVASKSALNKQNIYNSPVKQMQRLREAGLPFAAFEAGQAGSQASLPDLSGFDSIGNAIGVGINQGNQLSMFKELLRKAGADADVSENLRDISNSETEGLLNYFTKDPNGKYVNNAVYNKLLEVQLKEYSAIVAKSQARITQIDKLIKDARYRDGSLMKLADAEFDRLVQSNRIMEQTWRTNEAQNKAFQQIIDTMSGSDGKLGFAESLLIEFLKAIGGGFSSGPKGSSMNLGF